MRQLLRSFRQRSSTNSSSSSRKTGKSASPRGRRSLLRQVQIVTVGTAPPPPAPPPPPPPPPPAAERDGGSDTVVTGTRMRELRRESASPVTAVSSDSKAAPATSERPAYRPPENAPPAGLLTAGDHDDLLNPLLYASYVARAARDLGQTVTGLPRVDTRRALTISVEDELGRPVPFTRVSVSCADGNHLDYADSGRRPSRRSSQASTSSETESPSRPRGCAARSPSTGRQGARSSSW